MAKRTDPTYVYIDGFNLYYGLLKNTKYKWLNLHKLCEDLLPLADIKKIYYFTAAVKNTPGDLNKEWRQQRYIKALSTVPTIKVEWGKIIDQRKIFQAADGSGPVEVIQQKEKHSDVHMSCRMILDAGDNLFNTAAVMTNDSDFVIPVKFVREIFKKNVIILDPNKDTSETSALKNAAGGEYRDVRLSKVKEAQFPETISAFGTNFSIPPEWKST